MSTGPLTYRAAEWLYEAMPKQVESGIRSKFNSPKLASFCKNQMASDFCDFAKAEVGGRFKTLIAEPPRFPLLLLLYPFTVGPRLYRAWERGREQNDYREMGDVLRRDLTAITFFVFALSPIVKALSGVVQNKSGIKLLEKSGQVLKYSQFSNYELDTKQALKAILAEGNGPGLKKAIDRLSVPGLDKGSKVAQKLQELRTAVSELVDQYEEASTRLKKDPKQALNSIDELAGKVIKQVEGADELRVKFLEDAQKSGSKKLMNTAKKMQEGFSGTLTKYAKARRLPTDVVSFLTVVGLIGWLPVWFNSVWNKWQFDKQQATTPSQTGASNGFPSRQPIMTSPYGFSSHARYPQPNYVMPPYPNANNPFARP